MFCLVSSIEAEQLTAGLLAERVRLEAEARAMAEFKAEAENSKAAIQDRVKQQYESTSQCHHVTAVVSSCVVNALRC